MHQITFTNKKLRFNMPEGVWEMTPKQYLYFIKLVMIWQKGILNLSRLKVYLVYNFLKLARSNNQSDLIVENVHRLSKLTDAYFTTQQKNGKQATIVNLNFIHNPLPVVESEAMSLMGPADALTNCSYGEVGFANANFLDFSKTGNPDKLDLVVAALYRPHKNKKRIPFEQDRLDHLPAVQALDKEVKFGIYLWFASCQKWIATNTALDIGGGITVDISSLFKEGNVSGGKNFGYVGVIYSLAESHVFGNSDKTAQTNYFDVLIRLVQLHEEAKKMKKNAKSK